MDTRTKLLEARAVRGNQIAQMEGQVRHISDSEYQVHSQNSDVWYQVYATEKGFNCSCPDSQFRGGLVLTEPKARPFKCKHIFAVELSHALRQTVEKQVEIEPLDIQSCLYCYSKNVVKHGIRHNKNGDIQRFTCRDCGKRFTRNLGFEGMKASPQMITSALQLYFTGESLRNTQRFLQLQGVEIRSPQTIHNWITKYIGLMKRYLDQIQPNVSDTWRADELWVKIKGDMKYVFALMDDETRFWIAKQVSDDKFTADVRPLFAEGKRVAGKRPATLITDGEMHFIKPFKREFYTAKNPKSQHVRDIRLDGTVHNNKMERINGEIRDREKVMRGLKRTDTPILTGYQLFHNYVRPHDALRGATPAEKCGIKIHGENKWLTLIQNASKDD